MARPFSLLLSFQHINVLKHKLHFINFLCGVIMTAVPALVIEFLFNLPKPFFRTFIYGALVKPLNKYLCRLIFHRTGM